MFLPISYVYLILGSRSFKLMGQKKTSPITEEAYSYLPNNFALMLHRRRLVPSFQFEPEFLPFLCQTGKDHFLPSQLFLFCQE